jgi:endonuclease/exonuclease/phosphatase family metal-dependent hydrolase
LGDFSTVPEAPELAPLTEVWTDARGLGGDDPGVTFPADTPTRRIDCIMVSPGIRVEKASVEPTLASDHLPVVADLIV